MKKIYLTLLTLSTTLMSQAQLTEANHAPVNGDTYQMYAITATLNPGAAGANATWNFSTIATGTTLLTFNAITNTNTAYPSASVAVTSGSNPSYFASNSSSLSYYGGNIEVNQVKAELRYTSPAIFASYPMSLNSTGSAVTGGSINATQPFPASGTFTGNSTVLADGSGTLILPGITYTNVLRVLNTQTVGFQTSSFPPVSGTVLQVSYEYYTAGVKAPVLTISNATANVLGTDYTQTAVNLNKVAVVSPTITGLSDVDQKQADLMVYPNPAGSQVSFYTGNPGATTLTIFDITGKSVESQQLKDGKLKLDVSAYPSGLYIYSLKSADNKVLKSGRITIQH